MSRRPEPPFASAPLKGARLAAEVREDDGQAARDMDVRAMLDDLAVEFAFSNAEHAAECLSATVSALRTNPEA